MKDFRQLTVWEKSHRLTLDIYRATAGFPKTEIYGLTSQIRRAASSVPTNIAEGCGRSGQAELGRFLHIAMGSASEVEYLLLLCKDLNYLDIQQYQRLFKNTIEIKKMLTSLILKIQSTR